MALQIHRVKQLLYTICAVTFSLVLFLLFAGQLQAKETIVVLGDSLSAAYQIAPESGWVALLENKLKNEKIDATVINSSISGDTSANGLARLPDLLKQYKPSIVIIELGGNDGLRGFPVAKIKENIHNIITLSKQAQAKVLLLGMRLPPNYGGPYAKAFHGIFEQLAEEHDVAFVPFFMENVALRPNYMQPDRIHPNQEAQPILLENTWKELIGILNNK